jgi:thiosulfate/3-mercaptopyruvate sulfurtransferase
MSSPLVTTAWLEDHLSDPSIRILEISAQKDDATYRKGHIPGAMRWFWKDLCWNNSDRQFVTPEELAERLGAIGIAADTTLVLYGDPVQYGTYAFWALTMAGHKDLRLLDGSRKKWTSEDRPMTQNIPRYDAVAYKPAKTDHSMRLGRKDVRDKLGKPGRTLIDARSPEEYSGQRVMEYGQFDHGAERTGRIPSAKHLFFKELINPDDTFKSPDELKTIFSSIVGQDNKDEIVCYCRLSHRATLVWIAMQHLAGLSNVKIYDGSWTEWGSIVGFPIEK